MGGGDPQLVDVMEEREEVDKAAEQVRRQYKLLKSRAADFAAHRDKLQSYRPGKWIMESGNFKREDFEIPEITTLLMVGPMGAGKSTLINNLIRVLNGINSGFDRAQVCGDARENGTLFLKEYVLCDKSKNMCVFDTRGFSEMDLTEDLNMVKTWMTEGVRHGEIVRRSKERKSDIMDQRARHEHHKFSSKRQVNFVIFVVSAVSVHEIRKQGGSAGSTLARLYKSPFLSFKDDRPVVVMTHGDELSMEDRVAARIHLGEILGVSPVNQIFDIPGYTGRHMVEEEEDIVADMAMVDMLEYALMRADRNLPYKPSLIMCFKEACHSAYDFHNRLIASWLAHTPHTTPCEEIAFAGIFVILLLLFIVTLS